MCTSKILSIVFSSLLICNGLFSLYAQSTLNNGLVAHYPFDGTPQDVISGNDAILFNGISSTTDRFGAPAKAYYLNGIDQRMEVPHSSIFDSYPITVSFWFMKENNSIDPRAGDYSETLLWKGNTGGADSSTFSAVLKDPSTPFGFVFQTELGFPSYSAGASSVIHAQEWHNIIGMAVGSSLKLYIDGVLVDSIATSGNTDPNTAPLHIGAFKSFFTPGFAAERFFQGSIDDLRIYDRALTVAEIQEIQNCPIQVFTGNLTLTTQAQVDAFAFSEVTGILDISGSDITNLDGLSCLTTVGSAFYLRNLPNLTNINGLSNLTSVNIFWLENCDALSEVDGLIGLQSVGNLIAILVSDNILDLDGLSNLTSVESIAIGGNSALNNIDGLLQITSTGGYVELVNNPSLPNAHGLSNLTSIGGYLFLGISALTNVDDFQNLSSIGQVLVVLGNSSLENLDGFSNLVSVGGLEIENNPVLSSCCGLYPLLSSGGVNGDIIFNNNGAGCTQADILADGPCKPSICPDAFLDFKNAENGPNFLTNPTIKPIFRLTNTGTTPIDLTQVSMRYYFTQDHPGSLTVSCISADGVSNCGSLVMSNLHSISPVVSGADNYAEVGFSTGTILPGERINVKIRISRNDNLSFDESDDHSFAGLTPNHVNNPNVTLYCNDVLIQGTEPSPTGSRRANGGAFDLGEKIVVHPNPFQSGCSVDLPEIPEKPVVYRLFDLMGKEVYRSSSLSQHHKLSPGALVPAVYLLQIETGKTVQILKLIKEN